MEELFESLYGTDVTVISNQFLSQYLADTKPEYIKVFLFYLWKGIKEHYTIPMTSSEIDLDENVVEMALKFWIKKKLMKKECLLKEEKKSTYSNLVNFQDKKKELINKNRKDYSEVEKSILFVAEKLLGQPLSSAQQDLMNKCYNEYNFDESLIQYLLEYCEGKMKTNSKYMHTIAESWYELGFRTSDQAKDYINSFEKAPSKSKTKKANNVRALDRNEDYDKLFYGSISNGKFR